MSFEENFSSHPETILTQAQALVNGETDMIANMANIASLLYHSLPDVNWAGFYLLKGSELVLGPFQGKSACIRIKIGEGVCGVAALKRETIIVKNVHEFPGHIVCDTASNSEIVVPIVKGNELIGVLDIDSAKLGRFGENEKKLCEEIVKIFM